jgi:Fic family protein
VAGEFRRVGWTDGVTNELIERVARGGWNPAKNQADEQSRRAHQVYTRNAAHVPPPVETVRDMMPTVFDLLESEPQACVRAVLGHFVFVFTHPYPDGNGRMGSFQMNAMMDSGGYP